MSRDIGSYVNSGANCNELQNQVEYPIKTLYDICFWNIPSLLINDIIVPKVIKEVPHLQFFDSTVGECFLLGENLAPAVYDQRFVRNFIPARFEANDRQHIHWSMLPYWNNATRLQAISVTCKTSGNLLVPIAISDALMVKVTYFFLQQGLHVCPFFSRLKATWPFVVPF